MQRLSLASPKIPAVHQRSKSHGAHCNRNGHVCAGLWNRIAINLLAGLIRHSCVQCAQPWLRECVFLCLQSGYLFEIKGRNYCLTRTVATAIPDSTN